MSRERDGLTTTDIIMLWAGSYVAVARCLADAGPWSPRRAVALALAVPVLLAYLTVQWLFLVADELLYSGYRRVEVREPLFVVGMPRSGTSFLQATIAEDSERFTALTLQDLLLAPSVTQRRLAGLLSAADRALGRPLGRSGAWIQSRLAERMGGVHPVDLQGPGEDFLLLLPAMSCFLLVVAFPDSAAIWELTRIDDWPAERRRRLMRLYRAGLQRHLYASGSNRHVLSKNPSFTACVRTLVEVFPDARFVCCFRDPARAIPSQLSSLRPGAEAFGYDPDHPSIRERFVQMYERFARSLAGLPTSLAGFPTSPAGFARSPAGEPPRADEARTKGGASRAVFVSLEGLGGDVAGTVERVYAHFGWTPSADFRDVLDRRARRSRSYRSTHAYDPAALGLDVGEIESRFRPFMRRLDELSSPEMHA